MLVVEKSKCAKCARDLPDLPGFCELLRQRGYDLTVFDKMPGPCQRAPEELGTRRPCVHGKEGLALRCSSVLLFSMGLVESFSCGVRVVKPHMDLTTYFEDLHVYRDETPRI